MGFVTFMASPTGRIARIVAGVVLVILGLVIGGGGIVLSIVGLVPLIAGATDKCFFAPLFKQPMSGAEIRKGAAR
jgi:sulfite exporter TauE/SafE